MDGISKKEMNMAESEKITINMGVVDLGQIDLLVEEGFYSSRTDFIRTAIRNQLNIHATEVKQVVIKKTYGLGVIVYTRSDLEEMKAKGKQLEVRIVGMFMLGSDVTPELAREVIKSLQVRGTFRASADVKAALADRMQ
jgi:Arc/MetJ-type ribon-helix-helix transcriptional regulator